MSDQSPFDFSSAAAMLVVVVVLLAVVLRLIPLLFQAVWQLLPEILVLWLIVMVLRAMVTKQLG